MRRFVRGRFTDSPGTNFGSTFSLKKSPGYNAPGHLDGGVGESKKFASLAGYRIRKIGDPMGMCEEFRCM